MELRGAQNIVLKERARQLRQTDNKTKSNNYEAKCKTKHQSK